MFSRPAPSPNSIRVAAVLLLTPAVLLLTAPSVSAHSALVSASPEDGARLDSVPAVIRLSFNQKLVTSFASATTAIDGGKPVEQRMTVVGSIATVEPAPGTVGTGKWEVAYRVVSKDGHPIAGTVRFTVRSTASARATASSPVTSRPTPSIGSPAQDPAGSNDSKPGRYAVVALLALALPLGYVAFRGRRRRSSTE